MTVYKLLYSLRSGMGVYMIQGAYSQGKLTGMPALEKKYPKKYLKSTKNTKAPNKILGFLKHPKNTPILRFAP